MMSGWLVVIDKQAESQPVYRQVRLKKGRHLRSGWLNMTAAEERCRTLEMGGKIFEALPVTSQVKKFLDVETFWNGYSLCI